MNETVYKTQMNTENNIIGDKKMDYKTFAIAMLYSKYNNQNVWHFLYEKTLDENQMEIEGLSKTKINTIKRNIKKLEKLDNHVIQRKIYDNEIVYLLFPQSVDGKYYVLIEDDVLRVLVNTTNSNVIKTYCVLKYLLAKGEKMVTREFLLEKIGLTTYEKNLQMMTDILDTLTDMYLIKKSYDYEKEINDRENINIKARLKLKLTTYEEWCNRPSQQVKIRRKKEK